MSLVFFFAAFATYLYAMPGTLSVYRDSGDLVSAIASLGIAHPPGYPLYVLIGKLFAVVAPWATVAYRANLVSALSAATTAGVLFYFLEGFFRRNHMTAPGFHAGILTIAYAMSPAVWSLARTSEMYALESTFAVMLLWASGLGGPPRLRCAAFLLGLGMGVHPTLLFLAPLLMGSVFETWNDNRPLAIECILALAAGLSVVLFIPLRGHMHPAVVWGDPEGWRGFWRIVTRADYGGLKLHPVQSEFEWTLPSILAQLQFFIRQVSEQGGIAGVGLAAAGFVAALIAPQATRRSMGLSLSFALAGPLFFLLSNLPLTEATTPAILEPYLILVNLLGVVLMAFGVVWIFRRGAPVWGTLGLIALMIFSKPIQATPYRSARHDYYAYDYGRNLMRALPPNAVLYDPDDPTAFALGAIQLSEKRRTDIVLLNFFRTRWGYEKIRRQWPDLLLPGDITSAQDLERMFWGYSITRRPFFAELPQKVPPFLRTRSEGLVHRILTPEMPNPPVDEKTAELFVFHIRRGPFQTTAFHDFFTRHLLGYYAAGYSNLGLAYANARRPDLARAQYFNALAVDPELAAAYNNLGILEYQAGHYKEAVRWYSIAIAFDPENATFQKNRTLASVELTLPK